MTGIGVNSRAWIAFKMLAESISATRASTTDVKSGVVSNLIGCGINGFINNNASQYRHCHCVPFDRRNVTPILAYR